MARETRTEYETVEKEVEVTICDCCGEEYDDDNVETVAVNPGCELNRQLYSEVPSGFLEWRSDVFHSEHGPSTVDEYRAHVENGLQIAADCTFDVCHGYLEGYLGAVPTSSNVETPRIAPREVDARRQRLMGTRAVSVAFVLVILGGLIQFIGLPFLGGYSAGLFLGMSAAISASALIERWWFDE